MKRIKDEMTNGLFRMYVIERGLSMIELLAALVISAILMSAVVFASDSIYMLFRTSTQYAASSTEPLIMNRIFESLAQNASKIAINSSTSMILTLQSVPSLIAPPTGLSASNGPYSVTVSVVTKPLANSDAGVSTEYDLSVSVTPSDSSQILYTGILYTGYTDMSFASDGSNGFSVTFSSTANTSNISETFSYSAGL